MFSIDIVLDVDGQLAAGSPLVVNPIAVTPEERQHIIRGPTPEPEDEENETEGDPYANLRYVNFHHRSKFF